MSIERIGPDPERDLSALERRLGNWQPAPRINRDRLMFEAGRAAADTGLWGWGRLGGLSSASLLVVALGLGGLLAHERGQRRALENVLAARTQPQAPLEQSSGIAAALDPDSSFVLAHRMLASGPDEAPPAASQGSSDHHVEPPEPPLSPLRARRRGGLLDL